MGDAIEVEAVSHVFKREVAEQGRLYIGAAKANMGHSAAIQWAHEHHQGHASLWRAHASANIGFKDINLKIKTDAWGVVIVIKAMEWPRASGAILRIRRIGVNSSGCGGANSHSIIESNQDHVPPAKKLVFKSLSLARGTFLIPLVGSKPEITGAAGQSSRCCN